MSMPVAGRGRAGWPRLARCGRRLGLALLLFGWPGAGQAGARDCSLVFAQEPVGPYQGDPLAGSRIAVLHPDGRLVVLTEGFAAAVEPCVSFDGRDLLFAGRLHPGDSWDIWEMGADGSQQRRITSGLGDCREPIYLARAAVDMPDFRDKVRWISFTSTAAGVFDERGTGPLTSLYAMSLTPVPGRGLVVWRTTYGLGGDRAPTVLGDGRVLFSSWQRGGFALMAISWAGEDINPFYGTQDSTISQLDACEFPDRSVLFVESQGDGAGQGGRLARVWLRRPLHSYQLLSRAPGRYRTPHPLPDGRIVVSCAPGQSSWGIYLFDEQKGRPGRLVYDDPAWHEVGAQPLAARPEPQGRIPMAEFASVLDVSELKGLGQLQCMNVYDSDLPQVRQLRPGQVERVRLVEGVSLPLAGERPAPAAAGAEAVWPLAGVQTRVLGEAPVEKDGSFYVNVAGNRPFFVQLLDGQGQVLHTMQAWTWVRAGDQRGCVGCHENRELAPENRATQALIRATPATLVGPSIAPSGEK